jgi:RNA ligase
MKAITDFMFSNAEFKNMQDQGYVRVNVHPDDPELFILNYTEKAAYEGVWNNVTLNCRGLIVDAGNWIIARPFPKFFNYGQTGCPEIDLDAPVIVTDKMDGSLGILYRDHDTGKYAIATRGSFTSDQAIHATDILRTKYAGFKPIPGFTYLFEIVYPENRIVCNYDGMDDLVFLGAVDIDYGYSYDADYAEQFNWPGPAAEVFTYETMRQALMAEPRPGKEGFVVRFLGTPDRVKIKQEDYIALHRIVTGLNARSVWQAMLDDKVDELIAQIPDEFHEFIRGVQSNLELLVWAQVDYTHGVFNDIMLSKPASKKDFALKAIHHKDISWALFNLWDGKDIKREFLVREKPKHDYSPVKVSNDAD